MTPWTCKGGGHCSRNVGVSITSFVVDSGPINAAQRAGGRGRKAETAQNGGVNFQGADRRVARDKLKQGLGKEGDQENSDPLTRNRPFS